MNKTDRILMELGHPERLAGTEYLRRGLEMYRPGMSMTKELYPAIAKAVGSSPSRVERCMRHSIETAWSRGSMTAQLRFFGYTVDPQKGRPTVGEYVAAMARRVHEVEGAE